MLYSSCAQHLKDQIGYEKISADKHFSDPKELTWNNYKGFESYEKPWSKKEIAIQQLNKEEETARNEYRDRPQKASGFHTVTYPLTEDAKQAIEKFKLKEVNWVQFSLDKDQKNISCVTTKNVNTSSMSEHLDTTMPQFYLVSFEGSSVLVYCCPKDSPIKFKMVYSTCKASFAETLKSSGISLVKKFDVVAPEELNPNDLRDRIREKSASMFKPNENSGHVVRGTNYSSTGGRIFFNQSDTNKPVFQRFKNDNNSSQSSTAKKLNVIKETSPLAQVMGFGNTPKKGIVIPPKGAYE